MRANADDLGDLADLEEELVWKLGVGHAFTRNRATTTYSALCASGSLLAESPGFFFAAALSGFSMFLSTWLGLKVSTRRALIGIGSPVCGLRPMRRFFSRTTKLPKPEIFTRSPRDR